MNAVILKSEKVNQEVVATGCEMFFRESRWPTQLSRPRLLLISNSMLIPLNQVPSFSSEKHQDVG